MWKLMRTSLLLLVLGVTAGGCAGMSQGSPQTLAPAATVQAQIDEARRQFADAYQRGDATALSELFAPDAAFTGTISPDWREGRDAIRENWARVFREYPKSQITFTDPKVRFYNTAPDGRVTDQSVAVETGLFDMRMVNVAGETVLTPGKYSLIRVMNKGRWEIVNYQTGPVPGQR